MGRPGRLRVSNATAIQAPAVFVAAVVGLTKICKIVRDASVPVAGSRVLFTTCVTPAFVLISEPRT